MDMHTVEYATNVIISTPIINTISETALIKDNDTRKQARGVHQV